MKRKKFLGSLALISILGKTMTLKAFNNLFPESPDNKIMPVLFLGHGSPMNAIEENEFVSGFRKTGKEIPRPKAILCISAHWETKGTHLTAMEKPRTIHDFGGFPEELYKVQYPAPGSPELASETKGLISITEAGLDQSWGLDHGSWSVVKHLYPNADVPVVQMSLDYTKDARYHFELGKQLSALRKKGVLIIGSGNMVHNLGLVDWNNMNKPNHAYDWAAEAADKMRNWIINGDNDSLVNYRNGGKSLQLAVPTPEHFLPLLYTLALKEKNERVELFNDKAVAGSLTMTSLKIQ